MAKNHKDFTALADPLLSVKSFLKTIKSAQKYSNNDYITSVIREKLGLLIEEGKKKNILVVDHMDRIDPEHLFRIISIFSSHIDMDTQANKFGFDKIIFVGDNENFRSIFFYKYGIVNNYNAYISKLSSKSPFSFDPERELYKQIGNIVSGIKFKHSNSDAIFSIYDEKTASVSRYYNYIICSLVKSGALSLREFVKFQGVNILPVVTERYIKLFNEFIDNFSIYNLSIFLNFVMPSGLLSALRAVSEAPLSSDKVIASGGVDKGALNSDLSIAPLQFYLVEKSMDEANNGQTQILTFNEDEITVTFSRHPREDRLFQSWRCFTLPITASRSGSGNAAIFTAEVLPTGAFVGPSRGAKKKARVSFG